MRQFDYNTISDAILQVHYTAREGGGALRAKALADLKRRLASAKSRLVRMFSFRHEFPNEWHRFLQLSTGNTRTLTIKVSKERLPYFATRGDVAVTSVKLLLAPSAPTDVEEIGLAFVEHPAGRILASAMLRSGAPADEVTVYCHDGVLAVKVRETNDEWRITLPVGQGDDLQHLEDLVLLCSYKLKLGDHG